jgi:hypothetical protein
VRLAIDALTSPVPPVGADSSWWRDYQDARTQAELTCEEDVPTSRRPCIGAGARLPAPSHLVDEGEHSAPRSRRADTIRVGASDKVRGGERQFAAGRGLAESNLHLFEPVQLLL